MVWQDGVTILSYVGWSRVNITNHDPLVDEGLCRDLSYDILRDLTSQLYNEKGRVSYDLAATVIPPCEILTRISLYISLYTKVGRDLLPTWIGVSIGVAIRIYQSVGMFYWYSWCSLFGCLLYRSWWKLLSNVWWLQDPKLPEHLARWGIDILKVEKTDKTMAELEVCISTRTYDIIYYVWPSFSRCFRSNGVAYRIKTFDTSKYCIFVLFDVPYRTLYARLTPTLEHGCWFTC